MLINQAFSLKVLSLEKERHITNSLFAGYLFSFAGQQGVNNF